MTTGPPGPPRPPGRPNLYAVALVFDDDGRVLLVRHGYGEHRWGPPGGAVDDGESPAAAAVREAGEEAGIVVGVEHLVGIRWAEVGGVAYLGFGFRCALLCGPPRLPGTGEIEDLGWFPVENLPWPTTNFTPEIVGPARDGARGLLFGMPAVLR